MREAALTKSARAFNLLSIPLEPDGKAGAFYIANIPLAQGFAPGAWSSRPSRTPRTRRMPSSRRTSHSPCALAPL
jgi:hypothetical protein